MSRRRRGQQGSADSVHFGHKFKKHKPMFWELLKGKCLLFITMACLVMSAVVSILMYHISPRLAAAETETISLSQGSAEQMSYSTIYKEFAKPFMKERYPNSKGTKEVVQFMKNSLNESGYSVNEQSFTAKDPDGKALHLTNIWAETKRESNNKVVLSCHHDSKIMDAHNSPFIAAIDSAIPCAILMYLAAISGPKGDKKSCAINDKLEKLDISLVFIFFDGEEAIKKWTATDSLYGSRYFAENIDSEVKDFTKNVKLFVLLDLLGSKDPKFNIFHFTHHKCFSKLRGIENDLKSKKSKSCNSNLQYDTSYKRNYFSTNMLSRASVVSDDHEPFLRKVKNILHLIPTPFPSVWHQKTDDEDHLHHPTIENLLQIFTQFIQDLSCAFE